MIRKIVIVVLISLTCFPLCIWHTENAYTLNVWTAWFHGNKLYIQVLFKELDMPHKFNDRWCIQVHDLILCKGDILHLFRHMFKHQFHHKIYLNAPCEHILIDIESRRSESGNIAFRLLVYLSVHNISESQLT